MRSVLLLVVMVVVLQGCFSIPDVNKYAGEGNHSGIINVIEKEHATLAETPLHYLYFLCSSYYEVREYNKFSQCAEYVLNHPDPSTEFYPGMPPTYVPKQEFKGYIKSYQARMMLEFGDFDKALATAKVAYRALDQQSGDEYRRLLNILPALEVQALALVYLDRQNETLPIIEEIKNVDTYSPFLRSIVGEMRNLALARIYFAEKDYEQARTILETQINDPLKHIIKLSINLVEDISTDDDIREGSLRIPKYYMLIKSYIETGDIEAGKDGLDALMKNPILSSLGEIHWLVLMDRAKIYWQENQPEQAISLLKQAVEIVETQRSSIQSEAYKIGFVGDKQSVYETLIDYLAQQNQIDEAFAFVEKSKARALVDILAQKETLGDSAIQSNLAELETLEQIIQAESVEAIKADSNTRGLLVKKRSDLQQANPEVASLVSVTNVDTASLQRLIKPDEQLLEYYSDGIKLFIFVADNNAIGLTTLPLNDLASKVSQLRQDIMETQSNAWRDSSKVLFDDIIAPVKANLTHKKLVIVPHGPLHYLPFAALFDGNDFFIEQYSYRVLPSASVMQYVNTSSQSDSSQLLALGNPDLNDSNLDLPGTQQEVEALGTLFPKAQVMVRGKATETMLKTYAQNVPMLHIASHGEFNPEEPLKSRLLLAADSQNDGSLTVGELYDMRLNSDLVTLSACQTGLGDIQSGDDVIGLTRGFLFAGASNIIASLWMVDDAATATLMTDLYTFLGREDKQQALRDAQLAIKNSYSQHPYYWAAFQLVGSGK